LALPFRGPDGMTQNRWFMLALLFLARTAMGLQFQTVGSVGPILVDALSIDYAAIGTPNRTLSSAGRLHFFAGGPAR